jgi:hypothetical protein
VRQFLRAGNFREMVEFRAQPWSQPFVWYDSVGMDPTNVAAPRAVLSRDAGGLTHEQFLMKRKA